MEGDPAVVCLVVALPRRSPVSGGGGVAPCYPRGGPRPALLFTLSSWRRNSRGEKMLQTGAMCINDGGFGEATAPVVGCRSPPTNRRTLWPKGGQVYSSRPWCQRGGSVASGWCPRRSAVEVSPDQVVLSPEPARLVLLRSNFGPDCFFASVFGVLFASFRDLSVIFSFLGSCL